MFDHKHTIPRQSVGKDFGPAVFLNSPTTSGIVYHIPACYVFCPLRQKCRTIKTK